MFIQIFLILSILYKLYFLNFLYKIEKRNNNKKNEIKKKFNIHNPFIINYQFIGNLYNKEKNIMLKLYGRERIRHVWDYFIIYNNHSTETKIDLSSHKNRLEHLDSVYIEIFQADFILYKNENKYKYYPYIFSS